MAPTRASTRARKRTRGSTPAPAGEATRSGPAPPATAERHQEVRRAHAAEIAEDYVEAIADLIGTLGEARVTDLARTLGVTHVTVVRTVARLSEEGLVTARPYRSIFLTERGQDLARRTRERHEVVVRFLEAVGVAPWAAARDAEGIEHHVSAETLAAFERFLKQR